MQLVSPTKEILLRDGETMLISHQDAHLFGSTWKSRCISGKVYARRFMDGHYVFAHRLIAGLKTGDKNVVDHINGNGLDNRRENLRICTAKENRWNQKKTNAKTGLYGVQKNKVTGRYIAKFVSDGAIHYIGTFATQIEAAHAYNKVAGKERGAFSVLNEIDKSELLLALTARLHEAERAVVEIQGEIDAIA